MKDRAHIITPYTGSYKQTYVLQSKEHNLCGGIWYARTVTGQELNSLVRDLEDGNLEAPTQRMLYCMVRGNMKWIKTTFPKQYTINGDSWAMLSDQDAVSDSIGDVYPAFVLKFPNQEKAEKFFKDLPVSLVKATHQLIKYHEKVLQEKTDHNAGMVVSSPQRRLAAHCISSQLRFDKTAPGIP